MGSLLTDLHNLPSRCGVVTMMYSCCASRGVVKWGTFRHFFLRRGLLPAAGSVTVCSRAPNYVAAHSTEPGQRVTTDPTNPLVRTLKLRRTAGKKRKESPATGCACHRSRSELAMSPDGETATCLTAACNDLCNTTLPPSFWHGTGIEIHTSVGRILCRPYPLQGAAVH